MMIFKSIATKSAMLSQSPRTHFHYFVNRHFVIVHVNHSVCKVSFVKNASLLGAYYDIIALLGTLVEHISI